MTRKTYLITICILMVVVTYLGFKGLGSARLWDDESQVTIMAKNLNQTGELTGWDGRNLYAYRNGGALDAHLRPVNPPLDIWLDALSFKVLGMSAWSARIPFVILGLAALLFLFSILEQEFKDEYWLKLFIFIAFAFSCTYLLNIRQARYYACSLLFSVAAYDFYLRFRTRPNWQWSLGIVICTVLSFFANPMLCAAFIISLFAYYLYYHWGTITRTEWKYIAMMSALILIATLPYAWHYKIWIRPDHQFDQPENMWMRKFTLILWNYRDLNLMHVLPWMFIPISGYYYWQEKVRLEPTKKVTQWLILGLLNILLIALISPQPTLIFSPSDVRYLIVSYPFLAALSGWVIWKIYSQSRVIAWVVLSIFLCTNLFSMLPKTDWFLETSTFRVLLPGYLAEIHQPYPTSYDSAIRFLETEVPKDATVYTFQEHFSYPLMFYVGERIYFTAGLNERTHLDAGKIRQLSPRIFKDDNYPDWLLIFGVFVESQACINMFSRPHKNGDHWEKYKYTVVKVDKVFWDQTQRPEIFVHHFGPQPIKRFPQEGVWYFKREPDPEGLKSYLVSIGERVTP